MNPLRTAIAGGIAPRGALTTFRGFCPSRPALKDGTCSVEQTD